MNVEIQTLLQLIQLATTLLIVPLIKVLWALNDSINKLKIEIHRDFVTKEEYSKRKPPRRN